MHNEARHSTFVELWLLLAGGLTLVGIIARSPFLLAAAALLLTVAGGAWLFSRQALAGVHYTRRFSEMRAFPGEEVELTLDLHATRRRLPSQIDVRDAFPEGLPVDGAQLAASPASRIVEFTTHWAPGSRQRLSRRFRLSCAARGIYRFGPASLHSGDPFGLFERTVRLDHNASLQRLVVYPVLYSVAELRLPAATLFGERAARRMLAEDPLRYAGVRDWQEGDSLRRIHWGASLRATTLQSRLYEPSEELQVLVVLNVATLERHWQGVITELHERAVSVAGSLAAAAFAERMPIGLLANGALPESDQEIRLLPGRSPYQLMHVLELLAGVTPFATAPIEELLAREAPRLPRGATLVLVTAMTHEPLLVELIEMAHAGRPVVLVSLAPEPPRAWLGRVVVYHLPHLVDDLIALHPPDANAAPRKKGAQPQGQTPQHGEPPQHGDEGSSPWARPRAASAAPPAPLATEPG